MPQIEYVKATQNDFFELVDLLNYVFGAYKPTDFEVMLPGLYTAGNFMTGTNYIVKENGRIVGNVGAYPAVYNVCGESLKIASITSVAVHPRARSKGYMQKLMGMASDGMQKDGIALSFLMGLRQRYEYFGYTPCGVRLSYRCDTHNIQHLLKGFKSELLLKEVNAENTKDFDDIYRRYSTGDAYVVRPRSRFTDIMSTWEGKTIGIYRKDNLIGYIACSKEYDAILEINIDDLSLLAEILGVYLEQYNKNITIDTYPHETELNARLSKFAATVSALHEINFNVIDYPKVLSAFLKLKCKATKLPDGALTIGVHDVGNITISVSGNQPSVTLTDEAPDVECTHTEAMQLLFSPASAFLSGSLEGNIFARCLLPIPLFMRVNDRS